MTKLLIKPKQAIPEDIFKKVLTIEFDFEDTKIEADLMSEIQTGDGVFDPHMVVLALDRAAAQVTFYGSLLQSSEEKRYYLLKEAAGLESQLRIACSKVVMDKRPADSKKPPSAQEVEDLFKSVMFNEDEHGYFSEGDREKIHRLQALVTDADEWFMRVEKLKVYTKGWDRRCSLLSKQADLMIMLANRSLISIPERRRVYDQWPGQYDSTT